MLDVKQYVTLDVDRTTAEKDLAVKVAKDQALKDIGISVMIGGDVEKAMVDAQAAAEAAALGTAFRTWYNVDPDVMYPAVIQYLAANQPALIELNKKPDADLVTLALSGDKAAHFVLKARQTVGLLNQVSAEDWDLAMQPKQDDTKFLDGDRRAAALEVARLFFTEALHQATAGAIGVHILKAEHWRL